MAYSIIRQEYSWGRLLISQASLQCLMLYHNIFSNFYELVNGFGFKAQEDDKLWNGFHSSHSKGLNSKNKDSQSGINHLS